MEIENSDNDNVSRIRVSVYKISGITIKATFGIWDTPLPHLSLTHIPNSEDPDS